jgi:hypothetical protein
MYRRVRVHNSERLRAVTRNDAAANDGAKPV